MDATNSSTVANAGWWGDIKYGGKPWTLNVSRPNILNNALNGRHISLWQSHGRYYDHSHKAWKWQRPYMFCTTEDLFTQSIVVPYLIPMLENAGAVVFTPRERDMQVHEVIVDNDDDRTSGEPVTPEPSEKKADGYSERSYTGLWIKAPTPGFCMAPDTILDGYNPFEHGTVRMIASSHGEACSEAFYQPDFPEAGRYAVYVSYSTEKNSVDDAHYTVYHKGRRTEFHVNQQMGGSTWVYLGTFDFDKGSSKDNRVVVSSRSSMKGVVTTDAVRFGGGMGNIARDGKLSGLPRNLEGARYYAQWAGAPRKVYAVYDGKNDYKEDINVRSLMTNWLGGGSPYNPDSMNLNPYDTVYSAVLVHDTVHIAIVDSVAGISRDSMEIKSHIDTIPTGFRHFEGKKVPFDLSLALHSDAGYHRDLSTVFGSLTICTTDYNDSMLNAGLPREHSKELARLLLDNIKNDLSAIYGPHPDVGKGVWTSRNLYDRNYSETRLPGVPSAIIEMLSHQSFPDMRLAHDPDFKFNMARSIYKTLLRYEASAHGDTAVVEPLTPTHFAVQITDKGVAVLSWRAQQDSLEQTATPTGYNVYVAEDSLGYDNGTHVITPLHTMQLKAGKLYRFRVTATNDGGESFPTEELCALYKGAGNKTILIINGFDRLSSPAVVDSLGYYGFDLNEDPGLSYGPTTCWSGHQKVFSSATLGRVGPGNFSYSAQELQGKIVAGNDFDYVSEHAEALQSVREPVELNIVSASRAAVEQGRVDLSQYDAIDLLLGNEKNDGHSLRPYRAFTPELQHKLKEVEVPLLVSGSYIVSDMQATPEDSIFQSDVLHCTLDTIVRTVNDSVAEVVTVNDSVTVAGQRAPLIHALNAHHYATTVSDVLQPFGDAVPLMQYSDGSCAAIAYQRRLFVLGFPLECIESREQRNKVMQQFVNSLTR